MNQTATKRVLLIDLEDSRRDSRAHVLRSQGYEVVDRPSLIDPKHIHNEGTFDLVIVSIPSESAIAIEYGEDLSREIPSLPVLHLTDWGVFLPRGSLARFLAAGSPITLIREIAAMLTGSTHIREIDDSLPTP
jgi:hypothetical protein